MKDWRESDAWYFAHLLSKIGKPKLGGEGGIREARAGVERPANASAPPCLASLPIHVDEDARRRAIWDGDV